MKPTTGKFSDRFGSPDFEQGKGPSLEKITDRKEKIEMKKYGIKPDDTMVDKIKKVIAEEMPTQNVDNSPEDLDDEEDQIKKKENDHKNELRIKIMQYLNPRIVKSKELKNYVDRSNLKEEVYATLNQFANQKLNSLKVALALQVPVDFLEEGNKKNKAAKKEYVRKLGLKRMAAGEVDPARGHIPQRAGREALKEEEVEQLEEANRNPNVMRQGRTKIIKARVRGGKVQRRKRLSAVKGYTLRGGKLKRMSAAERLRRKRGARRGKIKRKAKMARALMRRKRSMRRRASLGLKE